MKTTTMLKRARAVAGLILMLAGGPLFAENEAAPQLCDALLRPGQFVQRTADKIQGTIDLAARIPRELILSLVANRPDSLKSIVIHQIYTFDYDPNTSKVSFGAHAYDRYDQEGVAVETSVDKDIFLERIANAIPRNPQWETELIRLRDAVAVDRSGLAANLPKGRLAKAQYVATQDDFQFQMHKVYNYAGRQWGEMFLKGEAARIVKEAVLAIGAKFASVEFGGLKEYQDAFDISQIEINRDRHGILSGGTYVHTAGETQFFLALPTQAVANIADVLGKIAELQGGKRIQAGGRIGIYNIRCAKNTNDCSMHFQALPQGMSFPVVYDPSSADGTPNILRNRGIYISNFMCYSCDRVDLPTVRVAGRKILLGYETAAQFARTPEYSHTGGKGYRHHFPMRFLSRPERNPKK